MKFNKIMIAVLSIGAAAQTVHAEDTDIIKYKINNQETHTVTVNGLNTTTDTILNIPETTVIDGIKYTVTDIDINRLNSSKARYIQRVIVPKTVTRITSLKIYNNKTGMFKVEFAENSTLRVIGDNACSTNQLVEFAIPSTVDSIGSYAFGGTSLQRLEIPQGVKKISPNTFNSSAIGEIVLHDGIKSIGKSAFQDCKNLQTITIPETTDTIGKSAFKGCTMLSNISLPEGLNYLDSEAFAGCSSLCEIKLPDGLTIIYASAFQECTMLSSVSLPEELRIIDSRAFSECENLHEITLPEKLTTIRKMAFMGCDNLKKIILPASVDSIGNGALTTVTDVFPQGAVPARLEGIVFADNAEIHVDTTMIETYANYWGGYFVHGYEFSVGYLTYAPLNTSSVCVTGNSLPENGKLTVPKSVEYEGKSYDVTSICNYALPELASEITIDAQVDWIGLQKFYNGSESNLTKIVLPQTLKRIGYKTFAKTSKLKSIDLPVGLESIEGYAFESSGISEISLKETNVSSIGDYAFSGCPIEEIWLPNANIYISSYAFSYMPKLKNIHATTTGDNYYYDIDGVLYRRFRNISCLNTYPAGRTAESYTVADGTQYILNGAFCGIKALKHVTLPEGLESISGFQNSGLTEISLPSTVLYIQNNAFAETNLRTLRLPENLKTIEGNSLYKCPLSVIFAEPVTPPEVIGDFQGFNIYVCVKPECLETYKEQNWGHLNNFTTEIYDDGEFLYAPLQDNKAIVIGMGKTLSGNITIPEEVSTGISNSKRTVTEVASYAFLHSNPTYPIEDTITTLTIPKTIKTIRSHAIENYAINEIKLNDKQNMTFEPYALNGVYGLKSFRIPDNAKMEFPNLSGCYQLTEVIAGKNNMYYTSQDGVLYSKNMDTLQIIPSSWPSHTYIMPLTVKAIALGAFPIVDNVNSLSMYMLHKDELPILPAYSLGYSSSSLKNTTLYIRENSTLPSDGVMWEDCVKNIIRLTDEEADGILTSISIVDIDMNKPYTDDAYYTLSGVRVTRPSKGLYIHKGRKVIIK